MTFEVADSVDPGDGNSRRDPSRKSLAGEVLKKKLQLKKNIVPPPAMRGSLGPDSSLLEGQPEGEECWEEEEDHYITKNVPIHRPSNPINNPTRKASGFVSTSNQTSKTPITLSVPELITAIEKLLDRSPHLKPYIRYRLPLERKADGYFEFPILSIFYKDSCEICLDHGEICTVDREESTAKCAACTRFGGKCIFRNLEGTAPRKGETHLNCGRCALGLGQRDHSGFTIVKQPFSPSKFLEMNNQVSEEIPMKDMEQRVDEMLRGEKRQLGSTQHSVYRRAIQPSSDHHSSKGIMVSEASPVEHFDPRAQTRPKISTRKGTAPISSEVSSYESPSETSLAERSSTSRSYSFDRQVETSSSSSTQELAPDSDEGYRGGLDANLQPLSLQATTTPGSTYISEPNAESIIKSSSQHGPDTSLHDPLVERHAENRSEKAGERRRLRTTRRQNKSSLEDVAKRSATETIQSNTNRLESFFNQPRTRIFEPETSRITPTRNEASQPWLQYREPVEEMPYEPAKPLFRVKSLRERQLELIKTTEKVYIPREGHTPDIREAREQLRYGFVETQGGELLVRRENLGNDDEDDDKEVDEELTTEQYWKLRLEEEHKSIQGSFWEHEPRRHR